MKHVVATDRAPSAIGPYSQAVASGGLLFVSGQIPIDPATGRLVEGTIADQTSRVLDNLSSIVVAASATLDDAVKTTIYLTDLGDFATVNEVYSQYFQRNPPARATVQVAALPLGARVEIDAIVHIPAGADRS